MSVVKKPRSVVTKRFYAGLQAAGFVVLTLTAWYLFASLAETVVNCVPWGSGELCKWPFKEPSRMGTAVRVSMFIVSLFAAIWVANRMFYTADTYEPTDNK